MKVRGAIGMDGSGEIEDGVLQLRYTDGTGETNELNAADVIEALQGVVELTSDLAKSGLFGDGVPPEVRIRPVREGSFLIEAVVGWAAQNPEGAFAVAVSATDLVVRAYSATMKKVRGAHVSDFEYMDNGEVKLNWSDGTVSEVPEPVWKQLKGKQRQTRRALKKILAPLADEAHQLELRSGTPDESTDELLATPAGVVSDRADYHFVSPDTSDVQERTDTFDTEAQLWSVDFRPGEKWRIATKLGSRSVTIEDEDFLERLDRGFSLRKGDLFDITIREVATTKNGRTTREWFATRVVLKKRGDQDDDAREQ